MDDNSYEHGSDEKEPSGETKNTASSGSSSYLTLQKAIEFGTYEPEELAFMLNGTNFRVPLNTSW